MTPTPGDDAPPWRASAPFLLWRANSVVHRRLQEALGDLGITITQWGLMEVLEDFGVLSASDLARALRLTPQSVKTALTGLESLDWVGSRAHPVHKRVVWFELTDAGRVAVADGRTRVAEVRAGVDAAIGAGPRHDELLAALRKVIESIDGPQTDFAPLWPEGRGPS